MQDTKLKKEENLELLKKLASQKVDTSLFQSSKKLGRGADTKREALRRALAESRAGIDVEKNEGMILEKRDFREVEDDSSDDDDDDDEQAPVSAPKPTVRQPLQTAQSDAPLQLSLIHI